MRNLKTRGKGGQRNESNGHRFQEKNGKNELFPTWDLFFVFSNLRRNDMEMVPGAGRLNHLNSLPSCLHIQLKPNMFLVFFLDKSAIKVSFLLQALSCWTGSGNFFFRTLWMYFILTHTPTVAVDQALAAPFFCSSEELCGYGLHLSGI